MIDYYFYFDRKAEVLKIYKEDCNLRASTILKKRRRKERILAASHSLLRHNRVKDVDFVYTKYMNGI